MAMVLMGDRVRSSFLIKFCDALSSSPSFCVKGVKNARHGESLEVHLVALCKTELLHMQEFIEAEA